jgi:hypothetical protein
MRFVLFIFVALLGCTRAVELGTTTYSLTFSVKKGEFERTKADVEKAIAAAKSAKTGPALELLLRSALSKVTNSLDELSTKQAAEAKKKEAEAKEESLGKAVPFVNASLSIKPLKGTGVGKGGKAVKRVSLAEFTAAASEKGGATLRKWMKAPLLVSGGVGDQHPHASRSWTAETLMSEALSSMRVKYVTPAEAKKHLSFGEYFKSQMWSRTILFFRLTDRLTLLVPLLQIRIPTNRSRWRLRWCRLSVTSPTAST